MEWWKMEWSLQATNHYPQWVVWLWSEELKVSLGISCINMIVCCYKKPFRISIWSTSPIYDLHAFEITRADTISQVPRRWTKFASPIWDVWKTGQWMGRLFNTDAGRNPTPVDRYFIPLFTYRVLYIPSGAGFFSINSTTVRVSTG